MKHLTALIRPKPLMRSLVGGLDRPGSVLLVASLDRMQEAATAKQLASSSPSAPAVIPFSDHEVNDVVKRTEGGKVSGFVLDARGINDPAALAPLLHGVGATAAASVASGGRLLVLGGGGGSGNGGNGGSGESSNASVEGENTAAFSSSSLGRAVVVDACEGFVRSMAKELGGKGVTVNYLVEHNSNSQAGSTSTASTSPSSSLSSSSSEPPAADALFSAARYFLSGASAFVTSQRLDVDASFNGVVEAAAAATAAAAAAAAAADGVSKDGSTDAAATTTTMDSASRLDGKTAVVTGAARGIGAATALALLNAGCSKLLLVDHPSAQQQLEATAAALRDGSNSSSGGSSGGGGGGGVQSSVVVSWLTADVADPGAGGAIAVAVRAMEGGGDAANTSSCSSSSSSSNSPAVTVTIDALVHSAGITRDRTLKRMKRTEWDATVGVNLGAVMALDSHLLSAGLLKAGSRVVCLSSTSGLAGNVGQSNYATSKAGLLGYCRHRSGEAAAAAAAAAAAKEGPIHDDDSISSSLKNGGETRTVAAAAVAWNCIAPGFIESDMTAKMPFLSRLVAGRLLTPLGQPGIPEDVAHAAAFLVSPASTGLRGTCLRVCGGMYFGR